MSHFLQTIIARTGVAARAARGWTEGVTVPLVQGYAALPITYGLHNELVAKLEPIESDLIPPDLLYWRDGSVLAFVADASRHGDVVYVETDYFGGAGWQAAVYAHAGQITQFYKTSDMPEDGPGPDSDRAINQALHRLGVTIGKQDEFDTIGLGRYRTTLALALDGHGHTEPPAPAD